ncbi:tetratricopeptide repeat protein [Caryophanon tenue]|uniref:Uncharacterized protein n=1 Tax=Caryophanon tenue TaxID=33978 RepID=A0A1C0Y749_9BACL|nr:tetratricopeptide repeat protein [Caryophanon tenue]OCS83007.1 hypothetical protein A6M13_06290 [Caryophanon tenue]
MTVEQQYKRAKLLMKREAYDDAIELFEALREALQHDAHILEELGLAYALNGQPYEALLAWMDIAEPDDSLVALMESTYRQLPTYDAMFYDYNEAILALKDGQFQQAQLLLHRVCTQSLPLPIYVYEAFILAMQYGGNEDKIELFVNKWPRRVQRHSSIQRLLTMKETIEEQTETLHILEEEQEASRKQNWMLYIAIVVVIVGAIMAIIWTQLQPEEPVTEDVPALEQPQSEEQAPSEESEEATSEQPVTETPTPTPLTEDEIRVIYQQGLAAYEAGQYNEARDILENGTAADQSSYMADDMAFFLAKTYEALGDQTRANELYEIVATQEGNVFVNSSYRDDSLLQLVLIYKEEDPAYATLLAERIIAEYPNEWTATLAKKHLEALQ